MTMAQRRRRSGKPPVFIDRDGTLIEEVGYLKHPRQVRLLPGAAAALARLKAAEFPVVVVSNQSGVGRGLITRRQLAGVNRRFAALLRRAGITLNGFYWCPHAPADRCACRKPKPGLLKRAARDLGFSWRGSISVGDRPSDVLLGQKAGGYGILVLTGYGSKWKSRRDAVRPDFVARDFAEAVKWIIRKERNRHARQGRR